MHFCPHTVCAYRSWIDLENPRANGHPNSSPWYQLQCTARGGYGFKTPGTIFHGRAGLEGQILARSGYVGNSRLAYLIYPQATGTRPR
jgi:hypothetical protein